jgi:hypothetical protein
MFKNTEKALTDYAERVVERARKNLNTNGFARKSNRKINSSGALSRGLGFRVGSNNVGVKAEFTSKERYGAIVEEGRRKGKMPPTAPLVKWIENKRIRLRKTVKSAGGQKVSKFVQKNPKSLQQAAYAMALSIKKRGIPSTNFMGDAMRYEFDKLPPLLGASIVEDLEDIIISDFLKSEHITVKKT